MLGICYTTEPSIALSKVKYNLSHTYNTLLHFHGSVDWHLKSKAAKFSTTFWETILHCLINTDKLHSIDASVLHLHSALC